MNNKIYKIEKKARNLKIAGMATYASMGVVYALYGMNTDIFSDGLGLNWETWGYLSSGMPLAIVGSRMQEEAQKIYDRIEKVKRFKSQNTR